jgi:Neuraminidase (sialidase)
VPDGSQWLASGTLYSKNMLISGKNRAVASTYFKADATAPIFYVFLNVMLLSGMTIVKVHIVSTGCIFTDHLPFISL